MNLILLVLFASKFFISSKFLIICGTVLFLVLCVFLFPIVRRATKHDKKLDDQVIALAVENRVDISFKEIEEEIQKLGKRSKVEMEFTVFETFRKDVETLSARLQKMSDTAHCTLTKDQDIVYEKLERDLGHLSDFVYSQQQRMRGAQGFSSVIAPA